ncbi:hypothetical protein [Ulvibacterium marinum]|nr:hypothetical protein [Ulvibacterium marinum]
MKKTENGKVLANPTLIWFRSILNSEKGIAKIPLKKLKFELSSVPG